MHFQVIFSFIIFWLSWNLMPSKLQFQLLFAMTHTHNHTHTPRIKCRWKYSLLEWVRLKFRSYWYNCKRNDRNTKFLYIYGLHDTFNMNHFKSAPMPFIFTVESRYMHRVVDNAVALGPLHIASLLSTHKYFNMFSVVLFSGRNFLFCFLLFIVWTKQFQFVLPFECWYAAVDVVQDVI